MRNGDIDLGEQPPWVRGGCEEGSLNAVRGWMSLLQP